MDTNKHILVIGVLVVVVLIFGGIIGYTYVAKPFITGYQVKNYNQGANDVLTVLINQIQDQGFVQIPIGDQTLILAPVTQQQPSQVSQETIAE
jgi:uncharacterized protein YneF (UPF0154 family)